MSNLGQQQQVAAGGMQDASAVPPPAQRRPRVREVSSRFMSSVVSAVASSSSTSSSSPGDLYAPKSPQHLKHSVSTPSTPEASTNPKEQFQKKYRSKSVQRQRCEPELPLCPSADQNIPDPPIIMNHIRGSSETPLHHQHSKAIMSSVQRRQRPAALIRPLLKENNGGRADHHQHQQHVSQSKITATGKFSAAARAGNGRGNLTPLPDTPTVATAGGDRMVSSRFRLNYQNHHPRATTDAAKLLLQSSGMSLNALTPNSSPNDIKGDTTKGNCDQKHVEEEALGRTPELATSDSCITTVTCPSSPVLLVQNNPNRCMPDCRTSMPEVNVLSNKFLAETRCTVGDANECDSSNSFASCSRSLNFPLSSGEHSSLLHTLNSCEKPPSVLSRPFASSAKNTGSLCLPPIPCSKLGADSRRVKKIFSHQEEVHSLKLFHNHYLQWRYANTKAEDAILAQRKETERKFCSLGTKISDLRNAVQRKRIELGLLQRATAVSAVLETHMPYLDEWSILEGEYSSCLSGAINALLNASLQLPASGNVQANIGETAEALNSASNLMETISVQIQKFLPSAEEIDILISELARMTSGERALIEDCGHMLRKTYTSQVEECSLRGHLIQLHRTNFSQPQEE